MRPVFRSLIHKRATRFTALFVLILFVAYLIWTYLAMPAAAYTATTVVPTGLESTTAPTIAWPARGQAAIATGDGRILAKNGPETSAPIASVAKVMTALAVMQKRPFASGEQGATLTMTQADVDNYHQYVAQDGSVVPVRVGERLTEYQALQALLLPSANNMAYSLANWAFGSLDAYTAYANNYAAQLGMTHTHFADASGFSPQTVSSAADLIILGKTAVQNSVIAEIVAQRSAVIPVAGTIHNVNALVGYDGFVGIKTGNTDEAGGCLLWAATYPVNNESITTIGAVVGSSSLGQALRDANKLLASTKTNYVSASLSAGTIVGHFTTPWGAKTDVITATDITFSHWTADKVTPSLELNRVHAGASKGTVSGSLEAKGQTIGGTTKTSLKLTHSLSKPSWWWRIKHPLTILRSY
jgi:D-alanyl-D-alanine carboxypeptidase (penicillin-binding protein 5/6)